MEFKALSVAVIAVLFLPRQPQPQPSSTVVTNLPAVTAARALSNSQTRTRPQRFTDGKPTYED